MQWKRPLKKPKCVFQISIEYVYVHMVDLVGFIHVGFYQDFRATDVVYYSGRTVKKTRPRATIVSHTIMLERSYVHV